MAEVLTVPVQLDNYYRSSSPRGRSPQQSYTPPYDDTIPRSQLDPYGSFASGKLSPPPSSTSSSPELSSVVYSTQSSSSSTSSVSSSICLDSKREPDDSLFFPVYDFGTTSPSPPPSPEPFQLSDGESTESPSRESTLELSDLETFASRPKPADDTCVKIEPSRHVDYLSHDWKEEDIWASWRYMVGKRKVHSNAARLENASWRTWAKKKNRLRTVSPDKLNWMKDCDVTWLYGPLSVGVERLSARSPPSPSVSPAEAKIQAYKTKPILKKRSMSEIMLQKSLSTSSLLKQATAAIESQQSNHLYPPTMPAMVTRANSDFSAVQRDSRVNSVINTCRLGSALSTGCQSPSAKKHIHFNDRVQQCIAVETDDMYGRLYDPDEDSSSDDGIMMARSKGRNSSRGGERGGSNEPQTIAHLPSTTLKYKNEPTNKAGSFMSLNSFFAPSKSTPTPAPASSAKSFSGVKSYVLEDDEDMAGLDWEPNGSFSNRRDSIAIARLQFGDNNDASETNSEAGDFQLPNFNSWDDDDPAAAGLFGRAVDAVNTARDIAHVLWNVGWRR